MLPIPFPLVLGFSLSVSKPPPPDRWFAEDKLKHFAASFVVTSLATGGARAAGLARDESLAAGATAALGVGVWKELRDARSTAETASLRDLVWDAAGIGAATAALAQAR